MIAPEGYRLVAGTAGATAVLAIVATVLGGWAWLPAGLATLVTAFTLWFFRDPRRTPPVDDGRVIVAPADGRVIEVVDEHEPLFLNGPARRLSIFLSPLNVHVNRIPCDGAVEYVRYVPGEYLVAWHPKASEKNERSEIGLRTAGGVPVLFKQIAGAVARRIVFYPAVGDAVKAGDRFGIVKFGSRMDVLVPPQVSFDVTPGQKVVGGETVIGRLPLDDVKGSERMSAPEMVAGE